MLHLVVQVDDYIYAGTNTLRDELETFFQQQFQIGSLESNQFDITGAKLTQHPSGHVTLSAKEKLESIEPISSERRCRSNGNDDATPAEPSAYRSVIGKILYIGRPVSPVIAFRASHTATK